MATASKTTGRKKPSPPTAAPMDEPAAAVVVDLPQETVRNTEEPAGQGDIPEITAVRVKSVSPKGFRRCGRVWSPEFVEVSIDTLPDGAVAILMNDPDLVVELVSDLAVSGK